MYLTFLRMIKESLHIILSILPEALFFPSRSVVGFAVALFVVPLSAVYSLAAKPIIFITWASIVTYVLWLACASYANSQGTLVANPSWLPPGTLWQGTSWVLRLDFPTALLNFRAFQLSLLSHSHRHRLFICMPL